SVHVQPRVFALLRYLAANPDRAISRDELLTRVWADAKVTDASLSRAIRALRRTLQADPDLREAVETIRGHGYRFGPSVEIVEEAAFESDEGAASPFVSREQAVASLSRAAGSARHGRRRFVLIVGEPGSGKTTFARRALRLTAGDFIVGEGRCIQGFGAETPYLPMLEALVRLARSRGESESSWIRTFLSRSAPSWKPYLPELFPEEPSEPDLPGFQRTQMARQMLDAIESIAEEKPIVLFIEDIHWADRSTLALLDAIARRNGPANLLTICTVRSNELESGGSCQALRSELLRNESAIEIGMTPLSLEGVREYVQRRLEGSDLEQGHTVGRFAEWLHDRTDGHPLFLAQLLEHLLSLDLLRLSGSHGFSADQMEAVGIPSTFGQFLRQWVAGLEEEDRRFLEAASVAGVRFDLRVVQSAAGLEMKAAEASCDRLCSSGWLRFQDYSLWPDGTRGMCLRFVHALFAEALYESIPPGRRARLHLAVARRLEEGAPGSPDAGFRSGELASHYERAGAFEKAVVHRIRAATFAASKQSIAEALQHADEGFRRLGHLEPSDRRRARVDLLMSKGIALATRHGFGDQQVGECFEQARRLAAGSGNTPREVAATWGVSSHRQMRGEIRLARQEGERLLRLARKTGESHYLLFALDLLCNIAYFQGRFRDCIALERDAHDTLVSDLDLSIAARSVEDVQVTARVYAGLSHWHLGDRAAAIEAIDDSLIRARKLGHAYTEAVAEDFAAILYYLLDEVEKQRAHALRGLAVSQEGGVALWGEVASFMRIYSEPPSDAGLALLRSTLEAMGRHGGLGGTFFIGLLADRELAMGNHENARLLCSVGIAAAERTTERNHLPALYLTAARLAESAPVREDCLARAEASARQIDSVALQRRVESVREVLSASADR
ncbi:MAG TPA: hypothetical protein ENI85_00755, partial [Deltaproteobacteria bacterium]|nr:hypothetical protein [Deltaproteobacteria bacterium]